MIKYFPLTVVNISAYTTPFVVMILAYCFLPEDPPVNAREFIATILAIVGTILIVFGKDESSSAVSVIVPLIGYVSLVMRPVAKATGTIFLRILKKVDSMTIQTW